MKKAMKISLIIAMAMIFAGSILFAGVMFMLQWDFKKLDNAPYETKQYTPDGNVTDITVITDTGDVVILPSSDGVKVECYQREDHPYAVSVENGILTVKPSRKMKWYENIGIIANTPKITVYLPEEEYRFLTVNAVTGDVNISEDFTFDSLHVSSTTGDVCLSATVKGVLNVAITTGDIDARKISVETVELKTTTGHISLSDAICTEDLRITAGTGKVRMTDVTCRTLRSKGTTGDITLDNVTAKDSFFIERNTGDVIFNGSDAGEISVKTTTGNVTGTLRSGKTFRISTTTGDVNVPQSTDGGQCTVETGTGDIEIQIQK